MQYTDSKLLGFWQFYQGNGIRFTGQSWYSTQQSKDLGNVTNEQGNQQAH